MRKIWSQVSSICWWFDASQIEVNSATLIKTASRAQVVPLLWYNMYVWTPVGAAESKPAWKMCDSFHADESCTAKIEISHANWFEAENWSWKWTNCQIAPRDEFFIEAVFRPPISAAVLQLLHYCSSFAHSNNRSALFGARISPAANTHFVNFGCALNSLPLCETLSASERRLSFMLLSRTSQISFNLLRRRLQIYQISSCSLPKREQRVTDHWPRARPLFSHLSYHQKKSRAPNQLAPLRRFHRLETIFLLF